MTTIPEDILTYYLAPCSQILCLATHSKLGLTSFVTFLQARQQTANNRHKPEIVDGGIIGFPVTDYLPQDIDVGAPPARVILMHHEQDPPRLLMRYADALHGVLWGSECLFHSASSDLPLDKN